MQHLGEICTARRSRGENKQDKQQVKPRKGFSNRRFERRFWVLLPPRAKVPRAGARNAPFSLLKEKRPSETKEDGLPRARCALAMTVREQQKGGEGRCPSLPFVLLFLKSDAEDLPKLIVFSVGHHGVVPRAEHKAGAAVRCLQHRDGAAVVKGDGELSGEPAGGRAAEGPGVGEHLLQGGQVGLCLLYTSH